MKWQTTKILLFTWHFALAVLKKRNKSIVKGSPPDGGPLKKTQDVTHITMWRRWPTAKTAQTPSIDTHRVHGKWTSLIGKTNRQIYFDNCNQHNQHKDSNFLPSSLIISWSPTHSFIDAEPTTSSPRFYEYVDRISLVNICTVRRSFWFRWQQSLIRNQIFWTIKSSCSQIVNHGGDGVQCFSACFSALLLRRFLLIQLNTFMSNVFLVDGRLVILSFCFVQKNCFHCFISFIIFRLPFIISVLAFHQYRTVRSRPSSSLCVLQSVSIF